MAESAPYVIKFADGSYLSPSERPGSRVLQQRFAKRYDNLGEAWITAHIVGARVVRLIAAARASDERPETKTCSDCHALCKAHGCDCACHKRPGCIHDAESDAVCSNATHGRFAPSPPASSSAGEAPELAEATNRAEAWKVEYRRAADDLTTERSRREAADTEIDALKAASVAAIGVLRDFQQLGNQDRIDRAINILGHDYASPTPAPHPPSESLTLLTFTLGHHWPTLPGPMQSRLLSVVGDLLVRATTAERSVVKLRAVMQGYANLGYDDAAAVLGETSLGASKAVNALLTPKAPTP